MKKSKNLGFKINIKSAVDMIYMFIILTTIITIFIKKGVLDVWPMVLLLILFLGFILQYEFFRHWIMTSLKTTIKSDLKLTEESTNKILSFCNAQKNNIMQYSKMTKDTKQLVEHMKKNLIITKQNLQNTLNLTKNTVESSDKEQNALTRNIAQTQTFKQKIQVMAELILELNENLAQIAMTVNIVEDIAEQTNMLALNAAVEAARAGEHGKGFAVVAGEIRKLADDSKQATTRISSFISSVQQVTNSTIIATEESAKDIEKNLIETMTFKNNIDTIFNGLKKIESAIVEIYTYTDTQTTFSNDIFETVLSMDEEIKEILKTFENNIEYVNILSKTSDNFKQSIIDL